LIRKKEQEIAQQIRAARREAETMTAKAREHAAALKDAAQREGQLEAEAYYRQEIAKAEQLAAHLKAMGQEQARLLLEAGRAGLGRAAQAVIELVLPK
jgi:hypothetical protein